MRAKALTVAGSDPSGGAGIQQDLKTFHALGVWGLSAVTAVTVQDTTGVAGWHPVPPEIVRAQIAASATDAGVDAMKSGMLPTAAHVEVVASSIDEHGIAAVVVDPVIAATSADPLADDAAIDAVRALLLPRALLVTPNAPEAERLAGVEVRTRAGQREAARALRALGARAALVTGGHLGGESRDVLVDADGEVHELAAPRVPGGPVHGTGCTLSAAIAAGLAAGMGLVAAVERAKRFVTAAIARPLALGRGARVIDVRPDVLEPGWFAYPPV